MQAMRLVLTLAMVLVAVPVSAQGGQGSPAGQRDPAAMQMQRNEMMFRGITLTDAQKAKIDSIQTAGREAMRTAMAGGGMQDAAARERMQEMRAKQTADIRAVLTAEQQAIFDANLAAMPAPGAGRRPPRRE
jgi:Spy/CpxP family protein refolding chaperone